MIDDAVIKKQTKINETLFNYSFNLARTNIEEYLSKKGGFYWVLKNNNYTTHSDLCFIFNNTLYSVLISVQKGAKTLLKSTRGELQIKCSKKYNFIPCLYPVVINDNYSTKPLTNGINLFDSKMKEPIDFENKKDKNYNKLSDWIFKLSGINYVKDYLISQKYEIISIQDILPDEPNIWYKDKNHNKSFVVVNVQNFENEYNDINENISKIINKYDQYDGYEAVVDILTKSKDNKTFFEKDSKKELIHFIKINNRIKKYIGEEQILNENPYNLINNAISTGNISTKKDKALYHIPDYNNLLLKIPGTIVSNLGIITNELSILPYEYDNKIRNNPNYGLPLYHICGNTSPFVKDKKIDPQDNRILNKENICIEKKVSGCRITDNYKYFMDMLFGMHSDKKIVADFIKMMDIKKQHGINATTKALQLFSDNIFEIPANSLFKGSEQYKFTGDRKFRVTCFMFASNYLETLESISKFEQDVFDKTIDNILQDKNFTFDFSNPVNILVDYEKQEFNFINLIFDKTTKINDAMIIKQFNKALLGNCDKLTFQPYELLFNKSDLNDYENYKKIITQKIEQAAKNKNNT